MDATITLRKITKENWETCIELQVGEAQKALVASNLYSLAEIQFLENHEAVGIYRDETMVGFAMFGVAPEDGHYWIYRLMIDERYQRKGYGRAALLQIIERFERERRSDEILIGYAPDNAVADRLYASVGFGRAEIASWGEKVVHLSI
ncbi:MAG: GNAT family N-acetyltransferase [Candidatus Coatesbacteria bacterium]